MKRLLVLALLATAATALESRSDSVSGVLAAAPVLAQQGPPPGRQDGPPGGRMGGPPQGPPQGPPPQMMDRGYIYGQMIGAIDSKASILIDQGKNELAVEELKKVGNLDIPKDHPVFEAKCRVLGRLAITYTNMGKKKEALEQLQRLLADVPPGSVAEMAATLDAGTVYRQCDMPEEALKAFDRAIELSQKLASSLPKLQPGRPPQPRPPGNRPPPN